MSSTPVLDTAVCYGRAVDVADADYGIVVDPNGNHAQYGSV